MTLLQLYMFVAFMFGAIVNDPNGGKITILGRAAYGLLWPLVTIVLFITAWQSAGKKGMQ